MMLNGFCQLTPVRLLRCRTVGLDLNGDRLNRVLRDDIWPVGSQKAWKLFARGCNDHSVASLSVILSNLFKKPIIGCYTASRHHLTPILPRLLPRALLLNVSGEPQPTEHLGSRSERYSTTQASRSSPCAPAHRLYTPAS